MKNPVPFPFELDPERLEVTAVHLQTLLYGVRNAVNQCPADRQSALRCIRAWLDGCIRYEAEMEERRLAIGP